jgi:hypothetical protein
MLPEAAKEAIRARGSQRRKERAVSRRSRRSFATQKKLAQDDKECTTNREVC